MERVSTIWKQGWRQIWQFFPYAIGLSVGYGLFTFPAYLLANQPLPWYIRLLAVPCWVILAPFGFYFGNKWALRYFHMRPPYDVPAVEAIGEIEKSSDAHSAK